MVVALRRRSVLYAGALAAVAGFVDGVGYIHLGGYFVSFMSGNSTRASADAIRGVPGGSLLAFGLVASFVAGVVGATIVTKRTRLHQQTGALAVSMLLLAIGTTLATCIPSGTTFAPVLAAAMGALNTAYTRNDEVNIGLTYMTGTLVKLGQHLTRTIVGEDRRTWMKYAALWAMNGGGAFTGALTYSQLGLSSLWIATLALAVFTATTIRRHHDRRP